MKGVYIISFILVFILIIAGNCDVSKQERGNGSVNFIDTEAESPRAGMIYLYPERVKLEDGGFFTAERGTIFVPTNRTRKNSKTLALEIWRFRTPDLKKRDNSPIFYLHGGPSFGGLESQLAEPGNFEDLWLPLVGIADVVVLSQRGIGPSKPTTTIETTVVEQPPDQPYDFEKAEESIRDVLEKEKSEWEEMGLDLSGFTIIEAAADVDDLRKAFGYERIVLWGGSFGSHWSMAIMRYYPEIVERAILRGMEGPDHTYDHPGHIWNVYERVAAEAEADPVFQDMIPEGGFVKGMEDVVERVTNTPFTISVEKDDFSESVNVLIDINSVKRLSRGYSGGLTEWPSNVLQMYSGNFKDAAQRLATRYWNAGRNFRTASYYMLDCGSGITAKRLAEFNADPVNEIISPLNLGYIYGCPVWKSDLGDEFRQSFETSIPTVIMHGTWDLSTPYENALELIPYFTNSKFIPLIRGPHGAIRAALKVSEEFKKGIFHFAETGDARFLPDTVYMPPPKWVIR